MKFSCLPWFIRKNIINSIIEDYPSYCLLNREWLIETAKRHGETLMNPGRPEGEFRNPPYAKYFGTIWFGRMDGINWDLIYQQKSLHTIVLCIEPKDSKEECAEFINKILPLPLLKSITANFETDHNHFDLPKFFLSQYNLVELNITLKNLNQCLDSSRILFTSLTDLKIKYLKSTLDVDKLLKSAPKLKRLRLESYDEEDKLVDFGDQIIPSIRELDIQYYWVDNFIKLDLSRWPNLNRLESRCTIEFTDLNHFHNIEDLTITGTNNYIRSIISAKFPKLRRLGLHIRTAPATDMILKILQLCTTIITLELHTFKMFKFPKDLPAGPYSVTDLYLKGSFIFNSHLLNWLSTSFNLARLKLKYCRLKKTPIKTYPFNSLNRLEIFTDKHEPFRKYFNRTLYPHINSIVIGRACGSCSHVSKNFIEEDPDESSGELRYESFYLGSYI